MSDYLKIAVDAMQDDEVEGPRVILGPVALERFAKSLIKLGRNAGLEEAVQMLQKTGATLPAKQEHEGGNAVLTGVSISMAAIESLKEKA